MPAANRQSTSKPKPSFAKDDKCLCFHGPILYEAKITDVRQRDPDDDSSTWEYKVHYKGWKNTWDDWVDDGRLRSLSKENIEFAKNLKNDLEAQHKSSKPASHKRKSNVNFTPAGSEDRSTVSAAVGRGTKRGRDFEVEREEAARARPEVKIHMPDKLKSILVDDWENVTKHLQLVRLPSKTPVSQIVDEWCNLEKQSRQAGSASYDIVEEIRQGLKSYFRKSLGKLLLYKFERLRYHNILKEMEWNTSPYYNKKIDDIYGCEHLLRLLVSFPELIAKTDMDSQSVNRFREEIFKLSRWLSKDVQVKRFLDVPYDNTEKDYQENAKNSTF